MRSGTRRTSPDLPFQRLPEKDALIRVGMRLPRKQGQRENFKVQPERPIVDIVEVVFDAPAHLVVAGDLAAEAADLRPAGNARLDVVPARILGDAPFVKLVMRKGVRPWPDQRHVAGD